MSSPQKNAPVVLVIDDDEVNRKVLQKLFERENITSYMAEDGQQGLAMARVNRPNIVLLDIFMPKEDGFSILAQFKSDNNLKGIPICIFSILNDQRKISRALEMGAIGYITKPFDMSQTIDLIKKYLQELN